MKGRGAGDKRVRRLKAAAAAVALVLVAIPALALGALGDFSEPPTSPEPVPDNGWSVAEGDFDNDGKGDLVTVGSESGSTTLAVLLGDGTGNFDPAPTSPETVTGGPWMVLTGLFDDDANLDLAVGSETDLAEDGRVTIYLGDGNGDFTAGTPLSLKGAAREIATGDFDGNGSLDLAVGEFFPSQVSILLNDGSGGMVKASSSPEDAGKTATNLTAIAAGDFNEDGEGDVIVGNEFSHDYRVILSGGNENGDLTVGPAAPGLSVQAASTGFLNADDALDVVLANSEYPTSADNSLQVLFGNGSGGFSNGPSLTLAKGPGAVVTADLNNDSAPDIAVAGGGSPGYYSVFLNNGTGGFTPTTASPAPVGSFPLGIAAGPLNSDGSVDLAISNIFGKSLNILLNDFAPVTKPPAENPPAGNPPAETAPIKKKCAKGKKLKKGKCVKKKCKKGKKLKKGKCVKKKQPKAGSRRG